MATITEDYVSFETAKLLKEKGFDWDCITYYANSKPNNVQYSMLFENNTSLGLRCCSAPTLQMAMKWLRKVHNQNVQINYLHGAYQEFDYVVINTFNGKAYHEPVSFSTYEEAVEAAIKYCLKNFI